MEGYSSEKLFTFYPKNELWAERLKHYYDVKYIAKSGRCLDDDGVYEEF